MAPSSTRFVESVWQHLAASGPTDFARKLSLGPDGLQKIRRWRQGGRLDYEDTMRMLEACGWLNIADGPVSRDTAALPSHLESIEGALADLASGQATILRLLERRLPGEQRKRA